MGNPMPHAASRKARGSFLRGLVFLPILLLTGFAAGCERTTSDASVTPASLATPVITTPPAVTVVATAPETLAATVSALTTSTATPAAPVTPALDTTPTPFPPTASPSPPGWVSLREPLLIDSEAGRIYASGQVDGKEQTVVVAARDGELLATYPTSGQLALDSTHGWLYADEGDAGVAVLNSMTGALQARVTLPTSTTPGLSPVPQADPVDGAGLAFRNNVVYAIDPISGAIRRSFSTSVKLYNSGVLPIQGMVVDAAARILYLKYQYSPAAHYDFAAVVSFDLASGNEVGRQEFSSTIASYIQAITSDGYLFGTSFQNPAGPISSTSLWAWRQGKPWFTSTQWTGDLRFGLVLDTTRAVLYGATSTELLLFNARTLGLALRVPRPEGVLAGYDPKSDQLYFLSNTGSLYPWAVSAVAQAKSQAPAASTPPALPVRALTVALQEDGTSLIAGIWQRSADSQDAMVLGRSGGSLFLGHAAPSGTAWQRAGSTGSDGDPITAVALSPNFAHDGILFAGVRGMGIFKSTDGGKSWSPSGTGLEAMRIDALQVSPGFADDGTIFAESPVNKLQRSRDAGLTWQALTVSPYAVALSPEFAQDQTLLAATGDYPYTGLRISQDGGDTWKEAGKTLNQTPLTLLSLAPLYAKWQVAFAFDQSGILYRTENGGKHWTVVLKTDASATKAQVVYAPDDEANRAVFLLVTPFYDPSYNTATGFVPAQPPDLPGRLFRSEDGGQTWREVKLPASTVPTVLAISPGFPADRLLYLGTDDGRIVSLDTTKLEDRSGVNNG